MIKFLKEHKTLAEILRFVIVGGIATVIDFFCMSLFLYFCNMEAYDPYKQLKRYFTQGGSNNG